MADYKYKVQGKKRKQFMDAENHKLEGSIELAPNVNYRQQSVYGIEGLHSGVFNGNYRFQTVTKTISTDGFTVNADVIKVKSKGKSGKKSTTKTKADKYYVVKKGDTLSEIALRLTGKVSNWKAIETANHALITKRDSRNIRDRGHWIFPGQKIIIPGTIYKGATKK